jgi:hypothetical protein
MTMAEIANVADLLAALGVIGTLIFLAFQIRQNTKTIENTHWESYLDRLASSFSRPLDEKVAGIIAKGNKSFNELTDTEKLVYSAWADEYILSASIILLYRDRLVLGSTVTDTAERRLAWFFSAPGNLEWWRHDRRHPVPELVARRIEDWIKANTNGR